MMQSIRRIKTAQGRYYKYCGILSTQKRSVPFRKATPERLRGMLRLYSHLEADYREAAEKGIGPGQYSVDDGVTWKESELTMTDHANSCAGVVSTVRKELQRRANQGRQRVSP